MMEGWRKPLLPPPFLYGPDIDGHIACESLELTGNQLLKQTSFCYHKMTRLQKGKGLNMTGKDLI